MLYLVYAVHGMNCYSWDGEQEWDNLTLYSWDGARVRDRTERWRMKMLTMCGIRIHMRNQGYNMPDWV
jgi:hypothetical protein